MDVGHKIARGDETANRRRRVKKKGKQLKRSKERCRTRGKKS